MEKRKNKKFKKEAEIKEDIKKIILPSFVTTEANNDVAIKAAFGVTNDNAYGPNTIVLVNDNNFTNKHMPFFYIRKIDDTADAHVDFRTYFNDIKRKFRYALGIPQKLKEISDTIDVIDHPDDLVRK